MRPDEGGSTVRDTNRPTAASASFRAPVAAVASLDDGWEALARCRSEDARLFFGPNRFEPKQERLAREAAAKAICATCPALRACREYALEHGELYGVWGGLGETDRRPLLADRGHVAHAV